MQAARRLIKEACASLWTGAVARLRTTHGDHAARAPGIRPAAETQPTESAGARPNRPHARLPRNRTDPEAGARIRFIRRHRRHPMPPSYSTRARADGGPPSDEDTPSDEEPRVDERLGGDVGLAEVVADLLEAVRDHVGDERAHKYVARGQVPRRQVQQVQHG
jgi:hypothetical protein